jgi:lantibiotic biosynthesis protein
MMAGNVFAFDPVAMARVPLLAYGVDQAEGLFEEGLFLASRSLEQAAGGSHKAAVTRTAYAIRARTRTTPQGVWCAVAAARVEGKHSALRLGERHRTVTVPSPQWLLGVADRLLETPGVIQALVLTVNNLVVRRGGRFEAEHPGPDGGGQLGSVLVTELSAWLLTVCADRALGGDVISAVLDRYPGAAAEAAQAALVHVIRTGILPWAVPRSSRSPPNRTPQQLPPADAAGRTPHRLPAPARRPPCITPEKQGFLTGAAGTALALAETRQLLPTPDNLGSCLGTQRCPDTPRALPG